MIFLQKIIQINIKIEKKKFSIYKNVKTNSIPGFQFLFTGDRKQVDGVTGEVTEPQVFWTPNDLADTEV